MAVMIPRNKAMLAASHKLPLLSGRALKSNLDAFNFSREDCYRQGAEEAQDLICQRLAAVPTCSVQNRGVKQ